MRTLVSVLGSVPVTTSRASCPSRGAFGLSGSARMANCRAANIKYDLVLPPEYTLTFVVLQNCFSADGSLDDLPIHLDQCSLRSLYVLTRGRWTCWHCTHCEKLQITGCGYGGNEHASHV